MRTINRECPAAGFELFRAQTWAGRRIRLPNGDRAEWDMSGGSDTLWGDAMIYYPVVFSHDTICHNRLIKNSSDMIMWQSTVP